MIFELPIASPNAQIHHEIVARARKEANEAIAASRITNRSQYHILGRASGNLSKEQPPEVVLVSR